MPRPRTALPDWDEENILLRELVPQRATPAVARLALGRIGDDVDQLDCGEDSKYSCRVRPCLWSGASYLLACASFNESHGVSFQMSENRSNTEGLLMRNHLRNVAAALGFQELPDNWQGLDAVWPMIERLSSEGSVFVLKLDGERNGTDEEPRFTVVVTGTHLSRPLRSDRNSLESAVADVLSAYAADRWGVSLPC